MMGYETCFVVGLRQADGCLAFLHTPQDLAASMGHRDCCHFGDRASRRTPSRPWLGLLEEGELKKLGKTEEIEMMFEAVVSCDER